MAAKLSRLITSRGGMNPGGGAVRVSPGVYRAAAPMPRPMATPQAPSMAPPMNMGQQMPAMNQAANQAGQALDQTFRQGYSPQYGIPRMPPSGFSDPSNWKRGPWAGGPPGGFDGINSSEGSGGITGKGNQPYNPQADQEQLLQAQKLGYGGYGSAQQMPNTYMQAPQAPWLPQQAPGAPGAMNQQQPDPNKLPQ